jgi:hypothetical protein
MFISEIRERARLMRDAAGAHIDKAEKKSTKLILITAWDELVTLCADASQTFGKRASISIPTDTQSKSWNVIRFYADGIVTACDLIEPPPSNEIPGDYGS